MAKGPNGKDGKQPGKRKGAFKAPTKVNPNLSQNKENPTNVRPDLSQNKENQAPNRTTAKKRPISPIRAPQPAKKTRVKRHEFAAAGDATSQASTSSGWIHDSLDLVNDGYGLDNEHEQTFKSIKSREENLIDDELWKLYPQ